MLVIEAIDRFAEMDDRSWWPPIETDDEQFIVLAMAAACEMSGCLDECRNDDDLRRAFEQFIRLLNIGTFTTMDWAREQDRIEREMDELDRRISEEIERIAMSN